MLRQMCEVAKKDKIKKYERKQFYIIIKVYQSEQASFVELCITLMLTGDRRCHASYPEPNPLWSKCQCYPLIFRCVGHSEFASDKVCYKSSINFMTFLQPQCYPVQIGLCQLVCLIELLWILFVVLFISINSDPCTLLSFCFLLLNKLHSTYSMFMEFLLIQIAVKLISNKYL